MKVRTAPSHGPIPVGWTPPAVPTQPFWSSRPLKVGSIAAFIVGLVSIPVTGLAALDYALGHGPPSGCGSDGCWFGQDSPGVSHDKLVHALSRGGVTLALFALAVALGLVQMRRGGLPFRLIRVNLVFSAVTAVAAVGLLSVPGELRGAGAVLGIVSALSLAVCWVRILQLPRRDWRART